MTLTKEQKQQIEDELKLINEAYIKAIFNLDEKKEKVYAGREEIDLLRDLDSEYGNGNIPVLEFLTFVNQKVSQIGTIESDMVEIHATLDIGSYDDTTTLTVSRTQFRLETDEEVIRRLIIDEKHKRKQELTKYILEPAKKAAALERKQAALFRVLKNDSDAIEQAKKILESKGYVIKQS